MDRYYARVTFLGNFRELKKILAAPLVIIFFFEIPRFCFYLFFEVNDWRATFPCQFEIVTQNQESQFQLLTFLVKTICVKINLEILKLERKFVNLCDVKTQEVLSKCRT